MIGDFLGITIVGGLLSGLIQLIKNKFGTESAGTKIWTIALSIAVGLVYVSFSHTTWWETVLGILAASQSVYALLIK